MSRTALTFALTLTMPLGTGCAARANSAFDGTADLARSRQVTINVSNTGYAEATIHVFRGGERFRLGIVGALDDETFTVDWPQPLEMQVRIRLLAGGACLTRPIPVDPGDIIELSIDNDLARDLDCLVVTQ